MRVLPGIFKSYFPNFHAGHSSQGFFGQNGQNLQNKIFGWGELEELKGLFGFK